MLNLRLSSMQIGRVAQSTGLSVDTIRFYEKQSLIPPARRTDAGYREYDENTVDRLQVIGRAQSLGFSLQEIRELLLIEDGEPGGCSHVRDLIADKVRQVKEKIAELRRIEKRLAKAQAQCSTALKRTCSARCPILQELESGRERGSK
jgi:MerR family copper efflux transcriptional regulator